MFRSLSIFLVFTLHFSLAWAQVTTATILGTVQDDTGGVLPGVEITVTHLDTNTVRTSVTDDLGQYRVSQLSLGDFEVEAALAGFQTSIRRGLHLTLGQEAVVNITMSVGAITEEVIVTGAAPLVETTSSEVSGLIDDQQIRDLPLNGRSFTELAVLQPGVVTARAAGQSLIVGMGQKISVNGSRTNASSFILDGTDINDSMGQAPGSVSGVVLGVETVREFKTLTSNFSAEYGRAAGGVISAVTKSGTNEFHGSLFEFHRNSAVDAKNYFDDEKPHFVRNQFGAVVGGPIVKDSTFFLGSFELLRNREGLTTDVVQVPNARAQQGFLPLGEVGISNCQDVRGSECFIGVRPEIRPYLDLYPLPNVPGKLDNGDGTGDWTQVFIREENEEYYLAKIDQNLGDSDSFFGRYTYQNANALGPSAQTNVVDFADRTRNQYVTLEEKHIFSPRLLNVVRVGFNRSLLDSVDGINNPAVDDPALGWIPGFEHMGRLDVSGLSDIGRSFNRPRFRVLNLFEYSDTVSYTRGSHSLKFGVKYQRYQQNHNQSNREFGVFEFGGLQSFLENDPDEFGGSRPDGRDFIRSDRQHIPALFIQDDFQATPNLTLNLGLRWEIATANRENHGKQSQINVFTDSISRAQSPNYSIPSDNFAPRVGFAWDPFGDGKTAIRGGFGMFHQMLLADFYFGARSQAPFVDLLGVQRNPSTGVVGFFPNPLGAPDSGQASRIETVNSEVVSPYYMQWNLQIQRELVADWSLLLGYVGSRGVNLTRYINPNSAIADVVNGRRFWPENRDANGVACDDTSVAGCVETERRNPAFTRIRHRTNGGDSYYHALQTTLNKRFASNYRINLNYTWAKSIDTSSQNASSDFNNTNTLGVDYFDVANTMKSVSTFHIGNALTTTFTCDLPFLEGAGGAAEAILGGWSVSSIVEVTSGTPVTFERNDGLDRERDRTSGNGSRPSLATGGDNNPVTRDVANWFGSATDNFVIGEVGFQGNVGRLTARGDDFANFDFSLKKDTRLAEDISLQFRAEFFNMFNHPNFRVPSGSNRRAFSSSRSTSPNSNFGRITRTDNSSRQIQFALKLLF